MRIRKSLIGVSFCFSTMLTAIAPAGAMVGTSGATAPSTLRLTTRGVDALTTATPIKHLVVIYGENVSFDHYFATYPKATNPSGEPSFTAKSGTKTPNGLSGTLLTANPNYTNTANGTGAANPFRLDRSQAATADQNHAYMAEEEAYDAGKMDLFPLYTGNGTTGGAGAFGTKGQVMGYYDGNTVTALWNYAQHYAMSDNAYTDTYGPSTPGALEIVAGQTDGLQLVASSKSSYYVKNTINGATDYTLINDVDPGYDTCSSATNQAMINAKNIGDLLNAAKISWGGFMGGFNLGLTNTNGTTGCARSTSSAVVGATADYIPHHNWFQYFASTANPTHARPAGLVDVGYTYDNGGAVDPANHQYDLNDFYSAVQAGNFPAVSYIKMPAYQDAHAGYSDPLDEQAGVVKLVNFIQQQPDWKNTAIIITYDDSDGWYDHAFTKVLHSSFDATADQLNGAGTCGTGTAPVGIAGQPVNGRCGPGTRIPFLVISPWARANYIDHNLISEASVVRFIEDNWLKGQRLGNGSFDASSGSIMPLFNFVSFSGSAGRLMLNTSTGEPQ
ncbi:phospholipase C [Acidocella aromatica]|uniref:Phospholipase C n=1 Tax=Acidocella aromatica TaxID=1303579 RepID=A0A840VBK0_9PROT|nr:alkaline phosphatase family protein [Acidocella aromatica]MBB5372207.1 phospholipase C [Acidocella aromatica]